MTRSALVPIAVSSSAPAATFTKLKLSIRLGTRARRTGQRVGGSLVFSDVGARHGTTDAVVRPTPEGADASFVMRKRSSPRSEPIRFTLPRGWHLRASRQLSGALEIVTSRGATAALMAPVQATDARGRAVSAHYQLRGKQVKVSVGGNGHAYPILVEAPISDMALGSWINSQVDWRPAGSGLHHASYGNYAAWYRGVRGAAAQSEYVGGAQAGAYIYKLIESGVIHMPSVSQEFGGIARAGGAGWETSGSWSGPDGHGHAAYHASPKRLSDAMYTYCSSAACQPASEIDTGNAAVFGLRVTKASGTHAAALIGNATVYEADNAPVTLSAPHHSGYFPGLWVASATDTVTATATTPRGLGIALETLAGSRMSRAPAASPACTGRGTSICPLSFSGSLTYNTAKLPEGIHTLTEEAVSAGGGVSTRSWKVNVDRKRPTIALSGALANENRATLHPGQYALGIRAADKNGSTPTSGIAAIVVRVDGVVQPGVSGLAACSFGASCPSSASAAWFFNTSNYKAGKHTVTVQAFDSARNAVTSSSISVTVTPRLFWGATIGPQYSATHSTPPYDMDAVPAFANQDSGGKLPSLLGWGETFYSSADCTSAAPYPAGHFCPFQTSLFDTVRQHGYVPILSWASSNNDSSSDPAYRDSAVASGSQDAYITQFAKDAKAWGHPFFLRFDSEMNGGWWNYGAGENGSNHIAPNTSASFVAMWRHVHDIFSQVGVSNVTWVWCPNTETSLDASLASVFPGNSYLDWTCIDGYNYDGPWASFHDRFAADYQTITSTLAPTKPMLIGETASTATGGSKPNWITGMFSDLASSFPKIRGFIWYEIDAVGPNGKSDWPIEGPDRTHPDTASINAFTTGIKQLRFTTNSYSQLSASPIPPPT
jgi:hypothetical protein